MAYYKPKPLNDALRRELDPLKKMYHINGHIKIPCGFTFGLINPKPWETCYIRKIYCKDNVWWIYYTPYGDTIGYIDLLGDNMANYLMGIEGRELSMVGERYVKVIFNSAAPRPTDLGKDLNLNNEQQEKLNKAFECNKAPEFSIIIEYLPNDRVKKKQLHKNEKNFDFNILFKAEWQEEGAKTDEAHSNNNYKPAHPILKI